jgi:hypothetical protein
MYYFADANIIFYSFRYWKNGKYWRYFFMNANRIGFNVKNKQIVYFLINNFHTKAVVVQPLIL